MFDTKSGKQAVLHLHYRTGCPDLCVPSCSNHRLHVRGQYQLNVLKAVTQDIAPCNFRYGTLLMLPTVRRGQVSTKNLISWLTTTRTLPIAMSIRFFSVLADKRHDIPFIHSLAELEL